MKTRLNIFCILIFVTIICSFVHFLHPDGGNGIGDFYRGFKDGWNSHDSLYSAREFHVSLYKTDTSSFTDSLYNARTGRQVSVEYATATIKEKQQQVAVWIDILSFIFCLVIITAMISQINCFIRFVLAVNRSVIFHWVNVRRLRWIGWSMIVVFISTAVLTYCWNAEVIAAVDIPGYKVRFDESMWDFFTLILGFGALIIAEAFAMGLRLQEEQELTV